MGRNFGTSLKRTRSIVLMNEILASSIAVVVMDRNNRSVDRELLKVGTAVSVELSVQVGEYAALQERVLCEVDASHNVAGLEL